jgi:endonuclease YncB( thermonuclease family)
MLGYDCAEMHSTRPEEVKLANIAKEYFKRLLGEDLVDAEFFENDKYGRPLVKLYKDQCCINDQMIQSGHGRLYNGGKKEK